jgi:hypothetical protein
MGFGYPREERGELLAAEPEKFLPPLPSDERYQWLRVRLAAIDETELRECLSTRGEWSCPSASHGSTGNRKRRNDGQLRHANEGQRTGADLIYTSDRQWTTVGLCPERSP